jgi:hypothetical protein
MHADQADKNEERWPRGVAREPTLWNTRLVEADDREAIMTRSLASAVILVSTGMYLAQAFRRLWRLR